MNKLKLGMLTLATVSVAVAAPGCNLISEASRSREEAAEWKKSYQEQEARAEVAELTAANERIALQATVSRMNKAQEEITRLNEKLAELRRQLTDLQRRLDEQSSPGASTSQ